MLTPKGRIIKGYKATDENMRCRGFQFELGVWYEHTGEIELCKSGFHFCEHPSGPHTYYSTGRVFLCEAEEVLLSVGPGAALKHVARRIRLVSEVATTGNRNTGNRNTGSGNTGNGNTGDWNTGGGNTGNGNTGDWNTGDWNTGNRNTGDGNTGDWNTGGGNTGIGNTGGGNTGNRNTGYWNTGSGNTGNGNTGNHHSGDLCYGEAPYYLFNRRVKEGRQGVDQVLVCKLSRLLSSDEAIDPTPFLSLPHATAKRIKALHTAHINARKGL